MTKGLIVTGTSYQFHASSEKDTVRLAASLARYMRAGSVIALDGDLGAGKTRFSRALAEALGVTAIVNSPTFTIIKEYQGEALPFYHMDVYRISPEEAEELGLDEYFFGEGVTVVEWASRIADLLPSERLEIFIEVAGDTSRRFHMRALGRHYEGWCEDMKENGILIGVQRGK